MLKNNNFEKVTGFHGNAALFEHIVSNSKVSEKGCWEWELGLTKYGYGRMSFSGKRFMPHRLIMGIIHGKISGLVCHHCDNRKCVNPAHLYLGTYTSNNRDTAKRGRCVSRHGPIGFKKLSLVRRITLSNLDVLKIRYLKQKGYGFAETAKIMKLKKNTINQVFFGRSRTNV